MKQKQKKWLIFFIFILLSAMTKAFVANNLLHPSKMLPAGTTGVSMLLSELAERFLKLKIGYWYYFFAINLPMAVWAYKKVNKEVVLKTILYVVVFSLVAPLMPIIHISDNKILLTLLSGIGIGTHISLMLYIGGTTGGVDLIGMYVSKKLNSDAVGKINNLNNLIIFTVISFLHNSIELGILSFIGSFLASMVVEKYHMQSNFILLMIVSKEKNLINTYITEKIQRTNVILDSHRGHNIESDNTMFVTLPKYRLRSVILNIKKIDENANLLTIPVEGVHHKVRSAVGESMI